VREYNDLVKLAERAAVRAGEYIRGAARPAVHTWTEKAQHDFATEVDRAAEALIAEELSRDVPDSIIVGEELSPQGSLRGDIVWIVDPLDGTTNFLHGYPQYAVSIACVVDGKLAAGAIHDVTRNRTCLATRGGGAFEAGTRMSVSALSEPRLALVGTGFPFKALHLLQQYLSQFAAVVGETSGVRRAGSAALDLVDVAAGRLDVFWEMHLAPWDVAAGALIVEEAAGTVTGMDGAPFDPAAAHLVASNGRIHGEVVDVIRVFRGERSLQRTD
jgi:myo-inositol-1(or 4)-monophosphatase